MRTVLHLIAVLALSGCLTTPRPVFNATNSVKAGDSPAFVRLVETWEAEMGAEESPREMITDGDRVVDLGGIIVIEDRWDSFAQYMAVAVMGKRVAVCLVHQTKIDQIAARHGVTVTLDRDGDADPTLPAQIKADGSDDALYAFVIDAFTDGLLICQAASKFVDGIN